ncbi:uncharacterized protein FIBRA_07522 [Fibroporia radiculosa]|uniref:Peptidase C14 caspase domain-containing protein n=1 Tax=Fibroporia radiculosa TaxID=599839 RepID=J4GER3_9APHY|nr:uncharacterized protein FIBRA_07522 [Fibroporia radiculosa]CCM05308.1 predicted protein [Fibroporia radiculosa]
MRYISAEAATGSHTDNKEPSSATTASSYPDQAQVLEMYRDKESVIGINYRGQKRELHGCVNDAKNVKKFLIKRFDYKAENIFMLTDDSSNPHHQPTRANIIDAMHWLVKDAKRHDSLVFHYSGHGGQTKDLDGDEVDGLDEVIFPVDYKWTGHIVDDEMHKIMVKHLPRGCRLTALFDSCHSGSALDLPYVYQTTGRERGHSEVTPSHWKEKYTDADVVSDANTLLKFNPAHCNKSQISWSGCMDSQTSADTWEAGAAVGAMSYAFMKSLTDKPQQSYQQLLGSIRSILKKHYSQKPQLSASHHIDTTREFIM